MHIPFYIHHSEVPFILDISQVIAFSYCCFVINKRKNNIATWKLYTHELAINILGICEKYILHDFEFYTQIP